MTNDLNQRFQELMLRFHQFGDELLPLDKHDITPAQVVYLDYLHQHPNARQSDLVEVLGYKAASVSTMISTLKSKGLLNRKIHPEDARAWQLKLSEKGEAIVQEISEFRSKHAEGLLKKLTQAEREAFLKLLEKILIT